MPANSSSNVTWQVSNLTRRQRWQALGGGGATVWLTGLPASGKSTIGAALEERLVGAGRFAYLLDGDNLRQGLCGDLGFSTADRARNIERVGETACLFADAGAVAIVALVSPLAAARDGVRARHAAHRLPFIEIYVDTPLEVCMERDPKGLYARARAGEIDRFTGIDDAYEPPEHPELVAGPDREVGDTVDAVLRLLDGAGDPVAGRRPAHTGTALRDRLATTNQDKGATR